MKAKHPISSFPGRVPWPARVPLADPSRLGQAGQRSVNAYGSLKIDPASNPAILDTATWDGVGAWEAVRHAGHQWLAVKDAAMNRTVFPVIEGITPYSASCVWQGDTLFFLAGLPDHQQVFIQIGPGTDANPLGERLGQVCLQKDTDLAAFPTHASVINHFCQTLNPVNAPRALGQTPRLGIGVRMTTSQWPGIFTAMNRGGFAANSIQNSARELNLLVDLLAGNPPQKNYACGFGTIETGYTGSTFEGLWVAGVLAALQHDKPIRYGADADHIQVKRNDIGLSRAKQTIAAARYYTFYTIDISDVLNYQALQSDSQAELLFSNRIPNAAERRDLSAWHCQECRVGGQILRLDSASVMRFAAKYSEAMDALSNLARYIGELKKGQPFDLELSIDEHPPEVPAFDCLTTWEECLFVLREIKRRGLPVTHLAPNFGIEKGFDYRHPSGLDGLFHRCQVQHHLAEEFGVMLDFHSADDLGPAVRDVFQRATGGRLHYKISPCLQLLFADVLQDFHPDLFRRWRRDALDYAQREAGAGQSFAGQCLADYKKAGGANSLPKHPVFHHYSFAYVGRRDSAGQFLHRHEFYNLSQEFYAAYQERLADRLCRLADELFIKN